MLLLIIIVTNFLFVYSSAFKSKEEHHQSQVSAHYIHKLYGIKKLPYSSLDQKWCRISVTDNKENKTLSPFWKSTGLCPPDPHQEAYKFFSSEDFAHNLLYLGSLPFNGLRYIRIHWLLDLVNMSVHGNLTVTYNFSGLDHLVKNLFISSVCPIFELMGNPSKKFSDFENKTQVYMWKNLIQTVSSRYINMFGIKYVSEWKFETWNEPDHHDFDGLNFTVQGFLNYYDACSEGLKAASSLLKLGGPGGSCHVPGTGNSPLCWELLQHCSSGKNYFTGETGVRLDFISFHKKGNGSSKFILLEEAETLKFIEMNFPVLKNLPFFNDEADPLKNWSLSEWWRADVTYAAFVVKVIIYHIHNYVLKKKSVNGLHLGILSNDNGFLSYYPNQFTQRTLLARFQINNTIPHHVQYIKKPVYSVMGLMSFLGPILLDVNVECDDNDDSVVKSELNAVAAYCHIDRWCFSVLICNSDDIQNKTGVAHVKLNIDGLDFNGSDAIGVLYHVNNILTNPYGVWRIMGSPAYPTIPELFILRYYEEPFQQRIKHFSATLPWNLHFDILKPGVTFLNICSKRPPPTMVEKLQVVKISSVSVQVIWKDYHNRCLITYHVEHSKYKDGPFIRIKSQLSIFPSYWHACENINCTIWGYYRVQPEDYWGQKGPFAKPVKL